MTSSHSEWFVNPSWFSSVKTTFKKKLLFLETYGISTENIDKLGSSIKIDLYTWWPDCVIELNYYFLWHKNREAVLQWKNGPALIRQMWVWTFRSCHSYFSYHGANSFSMTQLPSMVKRRILISPKWLNGTICIKRLVKGL